MGKFEVTQEQYRAVMGTNPSYFTGDMNLPVEEVSWEDAVAFCQALSTRVGRTIRLPSEAEWEYACKAGGGDTKYYFGNDDAQMGNYMWYEYNSGGTTHVVGGKLPNSWGLYDMSGNVWEWCQDWWHSDYTGAPSDGMAWTTGGDSLARIFRGGSWNGFDAFGYCCRSASRCWGRPDQHGSYGIRVVMDMREWAPMVGERTNWLEGVWGTGPDNVFAVGGPGGDGKVYRYDGSSWLVFKDHLAGTMYDVHGTSPNDFFAVGGVTAWRSFIVHYKGGSDWEWWSDTVPIYLHGVWAFAPNDVYAVGGPYILHYDGNDVWSTMDHPTEEGLSELWASGPNNVYAVGGHPNCRLILRYDGSSWKEEYNEPVAGEGLSSIWGSAPNDVFAVGTSGTILHYDGSTWSAMPSGTTAVLGEVWGTGPHDVYAVGPGGTIVHYDGSTWSAMNSGVTVPLNCVWSSSPDDVFAVGHGDTILHYPTYRLTVTKTSHPEWGNVTVKSSGTQYSNDPDNGIYYCDPNAIVTVRADPCDGKAFMGWEGDVDPNHKWDNPVTITMDSPKEISVAFKCGFGIGPMMPLMSLGLCGMLVVRRRR
jgi:hypothetical protein